MMTVNYPGRLIVLKLAAYIGRFRVWLADKLSHVEQSDLYAIAREHEREDVVAEIAKFRAVTGNRRLRELEDRIVDGKHRVSGGKRRGLAPG